MVDTKNIEISNCVAVIVDSNKDNCLNLESEVLIFDAQQRSKGQIILLMEAKLPERKK